MEVAEEHFQSIMSSPPLRQADLNWPELNFQSHDLASLVEPFTEEELHKIVKQTPSDKAPGRMDSQEPSLKAAGRSSRGTFCAQCNISMVIAARGFHRSNIPALLFKLDITKAFDTVRLLAGSNAPPRFSTEMVCLAIVYLGLFVF